MDLKVISLNIWRGALLQNALTFLKEQDADIVALQEVTNSDDRSLPEEFRLYGVLQRELNYPYHFFARMLKNVRAEGKIPEGVAIFSKFPLTEKEIVFFENYNETYLDTPENFATSPRCMQHVVVSTSSAEINVFNMHGVWDLDGDNYSPQRQKMSKLTCEAVDGLYNVILMGDTNAKPTNQAMVNVEKHLKSVFGTDVQSTFNMQRKTNPGYATAAVDMMFASPAIQVVQKAVPKIDVSDHLPLVVTVRI
jgi:endonuclease/exonuclease/phosphatase family metal-dependent hydrolase